MNARNHGMGFGKCRLVLGRLAAGIIVLGTAGMVQSADAKFAPRDDRFNAPVSHNNRFNDAPSNRERISAPPQYVPPARQFAPPTRAINSDPPRSFGGDLRWNAGPQPAPRVINQNPPRSFGVDTRINTMQQAPATVLERAKLPDTRSFLAAGGDRGGSDRRGIDTGGTDRAKDIAPPVRRNIQRDTPPPSGQNLGSNPIVRQGPPPPPPDTSGQSKVSDVRQKLDNKIGTPGAGTSTFDRRTGADRKLDKGIGSPNADTTLQIKKLDNKTGTPGTGLSTLERRTGGDRKLDKGALPTDAKIRSAASRRPDEGWRCSQAARRPRQGLNSGHAGQRH